ncbi:MAG: M1 family aminopeptidase [Acidobacteriota bacterium]
MAPLLQQIRAAQLDLSQPLDPSGLRLNTGFATLDLSHGVLLPVRTDDGRIVEMVFVGRGKATLEPPDSIEAAQLELFTGSPRLDETFTEAVFVIARDVAAQALLRRPPAVGVAEDQLRRATARYEQWKESPERKTLGVETGILLDTLGDALYEDYFAGWFLGESLGPFLLQVDPAAVEQINLGQFVRLEVEGEKRKSLARFLHRQQQQGRLVGLEVDKIGRFDSWILTPLRTSSGQPRPGSAGFEPVHYELDVTVDPQADQLTSRSRVTLRTVGAGRRVVRLELHGDLEITRLATAEGEELLFLRDGNAVQVLLPRVPEAGTYLTLEVDCRGGFFDRGAGGDWALRDTLGWYPRTGAEERATYDVTLRWPRPLELLASGKVVDKGQSSDRRWQRRTLDLPSLGFSFEVGDFTLKTAKAGHVKLRIALDPDTQAKAPPGTLDELTATVAKSLRYYEHIFGPYPLDELAIVTVPRQYSQAMLGFITLSGRVMVDWGVFGPMLKVQDSGSVVAHEVAHQWWGHLVGWQSYRDQWISEAMANYSALLFAREHGRQPTMGPVTGWQQELTTTMADGRSIESLGPLVLGERLYSSRSQDAYHAIVYRKGALVLEMLARKLGEENFVDALGEVVRTATGQVLSTADLLSLLEKFTQTDLDDFARQFIYGTGLPEIYYDYRFESASHGRWRVYLEAEQRIPTRYRYEVVPTADGQLDVGRRRIEPAIEVERSELVVPFEILLARDPKSAARRARDQAVYHAPPAPQKAIRGRMVITGRLTEAEFEIEHMPAELHLDAKREIFGRFLDRRHHPKRLLLDHATQEATEGRLAEAEALLRQALGTRSPIASTDDLLETHLHLQLATVLLDAGHDQDAANRLELARHARSKHQAEMPPLEARRIECAFEILAARLEIRRGEHEAAFQRLNRGVLDRRDAAATEGYLLLAIAADATGRQHELGEALAVARQRGADISRLQADPEPTLLSSVR